MPGYNGIYNMNHARVSFHIESEQPIPRTRILTTGEIVGMLHGVKITSHRMRKNEINPEVDCVELYYKHRNVGNAVVEAQLSALGGAGKWTNEEIFAGNLIHIFDAVWEIQGAKNEAAAVARKAAWESVQRSGAQFKD